MDLRLLGPLEISDVSTGSGELGGTRQRALLALLALEAPALVSTDSIIEHLWGDSDATNPGAALHMAVSRLRDAVGEDLLVTEPGGYRLDLPVPNTDINRFRSLTRRGLQLHTLGHSDLAAETYRHALSQWRGPALPGLRSFEFVEQAARLLEEDRVAVVEYLMDAMLASGEHDLVVGELFGLVESYPFRERMWELLMLALYRGGRQAEALDAFRQLRARLGEELGLEPSPDLLDLEERILLHDPALTDFRPAPVDLDIDVAYLSFAPGEKIVEEGEQATSVYWIEEGRVQVVKTDSQGVARRLAELGQNRYFGELAATLGTRRTASVVAMVPTTVSVHSLESLRARLGVERTTTAMNPDITKSVRDLIRRGEYLTAFDEAASNIDHGDLDPETRYLAVLALARAGATNQARKRYLQYGLNTLDTSQISLQLGHDIVVLSARLDKDEALARDDQDGRREWALRSAAGYARAYATSSLAYHAVNAATMSLVAGDVEQATALARRALGESELEDGGYWDAVTEAEASLVLGDLDRARRSIALAGQTAPDEMAKRATTLKQLKLVCQLSGIDSEVLGPLWNTRVLHYCGHRILPKGQHGRFPAEEEDRVRAELDKSLEHLDVGIGFGSLAAGADILCAEALLARGAELNVVLPFGRDEFVRTSVLSAGSSWVERFERCLASAASVEFASQSEYLNDPVMFDFCSRIAMGAALIRARNLETVAHQVAVWDGTNTDGVAGTAVDIRTWSATGAPSTYIPVQAATRSADSGGGARPGRQIRAVLFADFAGFSRLTDAQVLLFQDLVMTQVAERIEPFRPQLLSGRTWGDGIYLVFSSVTAAAECALDLVAAIDSTDMAAVGLPQLRGLRVAAHAAPVFEGWDPIAGTNIFFGAGVTQAARIEPRTPEGEIYTTKAFAAMAMLESMAKFDCHYVGVLPTAKQYGDYPLYALRRRSRFS